MSADPGGDRARELLNRVRNARPRRRPRPDPQWSGPGPDDRDPKPLADGVAAVVNEHGWARRLDEASIGPRWAAIVGDTVAAHSRPETLSDGVLTVRAASTAWATQLRLMAATLLARIAAEVGDGIVTRVRVVGPATPHWRHGPLRVRGRGPRDTYG